MEKIKNYILKFSTYLFSNLSSKIVFYHDVHKEGQSYTSMSTSIDRFKEHMTTLVMEGFKVVKSIDNSERQIQICFDDGFRGIYHNKDFFLSHGIYPTIFLAIDLIGKPGYLNEIEILDLQDLGFVFESHAFSHKDLTGFNDDDLRYELEASKHYLESLLSKSITSICFPIGYFSERVIRFSHVAGYQKLYSSLPGNYITSREDGLIYRNLVQFATDKEFKSIIYGGMAPLRWWYKRKHYRTHNIK